MRARWEDEVDLAVALLNTVDHLDDPADRLVSIGLLRRILAEGGLDELGRQLRPADLPEVRARREQLRTLFTAPSWGERAEALNSLLSSSRARPQLVATGEDRFEMKATGPTPVDALTARLATALAEAVVSGGFGRLGTCDASPCSCVYVDRTRSANRRYCCDICNDRAAAAAYRRRKARGTSPQHSLARRSGREA